MNACWYQYAPTVVLLLLLGCCSSGCKPSRGGGLPGEKPVARVGSAYLYPSDIVGLTDNTLSEQDSQRLVSMYIDEWVRNRLVLSAAERNVGTNDRIERLVAEYRASLLVEEYHRALLYERLDSNVTVQQISDYYDGHKEKYMLDESRVRCFMIKVPRVLPASDTLQRLFKAHSGNEDFQRPMAEICSRNRLLYHLDEYEWLRLSRLAAELPGGAFSETELTTKGMYTKSVGDYLYLVRIFEVVPRNTVAPISLVMPEIKNSILHRRKSELLAKIREELYQKAINNREVEFMNP